MEFKELTEAVKRIDIRAVLQALRIQYKEDKNGRVIFRLRDDDDKPSVSAIIRNGVWIFRDFGDASIRGTVIDLYMHVTGATFTQAVQDLVEFLNDDNIVREKDYIKETKSIQDKQATSSNKATSNKVEILDATSFFLDAQKEYLKKRCVWPPIKGLKNIKYQVKGKVYYGIGMQMVNGHYVIRVPFENSSVRYIYSGHVDLIFMQGETDKIYVVEGLFDGLSIKKLYSDANVLILNSVNNKHKAVSFLQNKQYNEILLALDNDDAGRQAAQDLYETIDNVNFFQYEGKDPNEYLCLLQTKSKTA